MLVTAASVNLAFLYNLILFDVIALKFGKILSFLFTIFLDEHEFEK